MDAINTASNGDTIQLTADIKVDAMLNIKDINSITLDLNNHTITASSSYPEAVNGYYNDKHLINIENSKTIEVTNGVLKTTSLNKHVLNVYDNSDVTLSNVTLDHTEANSGAPLVVNGSKVTLKGENTFITGNNSWYAVNIDDKGNESGAGVSTEKNTVLHFEGAKSVGFQFDTTDNGGVSLNFGEGTTATSEIEGFELSKVGKVSDEALVNSNSEIVKINPEPEPTPEPTPTPGGDDDELPPYIPSQSSNDDDTVTIVACAAAAAVAAILAVFLVIDRK